MQDLILSIGIKPFACTEPGCGRKFTIRPDLNDHIRKSHTGERPFHCTECDKRFLTGSVYYQHRLIHRGDRRYACQQCEKRFYRADALKNHVRIHSGEKPYRCPVCERCFRQRGDRDKHLKVFRLTLLTWLDFWLYSWISMILTVNMLSTTWNSRAYMLFFKMHPGFAENPTKSLKYRRTNLF